MAAAAVSPKRNYLNASYNIWSWFLTVDHKRIAILYMISITLFFFVGGAAAVALRLELMAPGQDLMISETYNKMLQLAWRSKNQPTVISIIRQLQNLVSDKDINSISDGKDLAWRQMSISFP